MVWKTNYFKTGNLIFGLSCLVVFKIGSMAPTLEPVSFMWECDAQHMSGRPRCGKWWDMTDEMRMVLWRDRSIDFYLKLQGQGGSCPCSIDCTRPKSTLCQTDPIGEQRTVTTATTLAQSANCQHSLGQQSSTGGIPFVWGVGSS